MKKKPIISTAVLSENRVYRYALYRQWEDDLPPLVWIGLNPSTADETVDDPTVRRVVGFSKMWGYGGVILLNLFGLRATNPKELRTASDPVGPANNTALKQICDGREVILAWGTHGGLHGRDKAVTELLQTANPRQVYCLGRTKDGYPKHPLYLAKKTPLTEIHFAEEVI